MNNFFKQLADNRKIRLLCFAIISLLYLAFLVFQLSKLKNGSYNIDESKLYKLDTIKLIDKAYLIKLGKNSSARRYEFKDENFFSFSISNRQYQAITEKKFVYDTLQNCNTVVTLYTDKDGLDNYINGQKSRIIPVYQLAIRGKKYIDIDKCNIWEKGEIIELILVYLGIYIAISVCIFRFKRILTKL